MKKIVFLELDDVLELYKDMVQEFGGSVGVRDLNLLESAIAQPQMTLFGQYAHSDIFQMAGAYCFHIIKNHPFVDGNKRTGILTAIVFLNANGIKIRRDLESLYHLAIAVADSSMSKKDVTKFFREIKK